MIIRLQSMSKDLLEEYSQAIEAVDDAMEQLYEIANTMQKIEYIIHKYIILIGF